MICVRDQEMRGWKILLCSCMLKDSNLISKADAANGDKVRIVITSATGKGKNLGPTGLREPFSRWHIGEHISCDARTPKQMWTGYPNEQSR